LPIFRVKLLNLPIQYSKQLPCETTAQLLSFCGHILGVYQQNKTLAPHKSTAPAWVAFIRGGEKDDKCKTVSMKVGLPFFIASQEILTSSIA